MAPFFARDGSRGREPSTGFFPAFLKDEPDVRVDMDIKYIEERSFLTALKITSQTIGTVLRMQSE